MSGPAQAGAAVPPAPRATSPRGWPPAGAVQVLGRTAFRFSPNGRHAACLARTASGETEIESWSLADRLPRWRIRPVAGSPPPTQPVPLDDGRVLLLRNGDGMHRLSVVDTMGERRISQERCAGLRLLPFPRDDAMPLAISTHVDGRSRVSTVVDGVPALRTAVTVDGLLTGGVWLDRQGRLLGVNRIRAGRAAAVIVDLVRGTVTPLPEQPDGPVRFVLAAPWTGMLLLLVPRAGGRDRFGWSTLADPATVRPSRALADLDPARVLPLATDLSGSRVALQVEETLVSRLVVTDPHRDRLVEVPLPRGCLGGTAHWSARELRVPFTGPSLPCGLATVDPATPGSFRLHGSARHGASRTAAHRSAPAASWAAVTVERFAGPAGPVEALVHCVGDRRDAAGVVVALHGGPATAWRLSFEPLLQRFAAAGMAVVAPNPRGSTGYGDAHQNALRGAWGVPDAQDVLGLARALVSERDGRPIALYGTSYGAFLALLAASDAPELWSRCVAVAPFLSAESLYSCAGLRVRAMVDRLGGRQRAQGTRPRDVLREVAALRAGLLLVHGSNDPVIPVSQSRALRDRLLALGRREGGDFTYLEIPGGGHDPVRSAGSDHLATRLTRFLSGEGE